MSDPQTPSATNDHLLAATDKPADLQRRGFLARSGLAVTGMGTTLLGPLQTSHVQGSVVVTGNSHEVPITV